MVDVCQIQASEWMPLTRATHSGTFSDETSLSVVASKARWHPFYGGVTCVNDDATIKLQWVFLSPPSFFSLLLPKVWSCPVIYFLYQIWFLFFWLLFVLFSIFFWLIFFLQYCPCHLIWFDLIFISNLILILLIFKLFY